MNIAYVMSLAVTLSIILALLGIVLIIIDVMRSHEEEKEDENEKRKSSVGGVVLIGPVPIIFGNDLSIIKWAIVLTIIIVALFVILMLLPGIL
ncbi:DUF131 domain-containing protein [Vulcanisaeta sp. JCM 16159]|uniref:TIGR00304 family membrane protein n=1 Tax=Vulcanisaeta sp. JCM 16159 TaxID=1295371 RepID=UPI0006D0A104|nr:DUF131 domain-containing protein [Vulcanisaeta sp. JCM 16159]